jgi:hypothetical protein
MVHPEASFPGRKWTLFNSIGVPLTCADQRPLSASTWSSRLLVSTLMGGAASPGREGLRITHAIMRGMRIVVGFFIGC